MPNTDNKLTSPGLFRFLVDQLSSECDLLAFISRGKESLGETIELSFAELENVNETLKDLEKLQSLWKSLLIEAIHFLRINDCRERAFLIDWDERWVPTNKTKMDTPNARNEAALNTYGILELYDYFCQFTKFESTLYGTDEYYRDHVQHPLLVWLIGLSVLSVHGKDFTIRAGGKSVIVESAGCADPSWPTFDNARRLSDKARASAARNQCSEDRDSANDDPKLQLSLGELGAMWTIAALTHDLGYPLEKVERINDQLEQMLRQFGNIGFTPSNFSFQAQHAHLVEALLHILSAKITNREDPPKPGAWLTHVSPKYQMKFSKSWESFDHGIVSSLILLRSLTFFLETDYSKDLHSFLDDEDARQFCVRSEILHTIAAHTTPKVYHVFANTLPFLLVLCDELQEWDRPTMADLKAGSMTGRAKHAYLTIEELTGDKSKIACSVIYAPVTSHADEKKHAIRIFRSWHERLRAAVFDTDRKIDFKWEIKFGEEQPVPWVFQLNSQARVFQQITVQGPCAKNPNKAQEYELYE